MFPSWMVELLPVQTFLPGFSYPLHSKTARMVRSKSKQAVRDEGPGSPGLRAQRRQSAN
jgi:hypothetical protein